MEKKRILVADDEETVRIFLAEALKSFGYEIDVAEDGVEAMNHIETKSYDIIITDYMMPNMNGLELTQRIKAKYPQTPILVITGRPGDDILKCGATACIMKPFKIIELQSMIKSILGQ